MRNLSQRFFLVFLHCIFLLWPSLILAGNCDAPFLSVPAEELPLFDDDPDASSLKRAVQSNLNYLKRLSPSKTVDLCGSKFSVSHLIATQETLLNAITKSPDASYLNQFITEHFKICRAAGRAGDGSMLVTGYYEPILAGSLMHDPPFIYPLYEVPKDLVSVKDGSDKKQVGRRKDGHLVPYWTRGEIEKKKILAGNEIIYLSDPVEAFILHVQGSGQVRLQDGSVKHVRFAGTNGRKYTSIGKVLVQEGVMPLKEVTLPKIINYLHNHPEEQERIFHMNDRYVFFSISEKEEKGPVGSIGQPLTAGRSMAIDRACFPHGLLCYLQTEKPLFDDNWQVSDWVETGHFVVTQDSGAAIKGPGRIDLFLGSGTYAEKAAGVLKQPGSLYFLILKSDN